MNGFRDYRFIKMITREGRTIVLHQGRCLDFGEGFDGIRRALHYVDMQRFIAKVDRRAIGARTASLHPVRSLVPQVYIKTVRYAMIVEEVV